jgi:hypothetical protein
MFNYGVKFISGYYINISDNHLQLMHQNEQNDTLRSTRNINWRSYRFIIPCYCIRDTCLQTVLHTYRAALIISGPLIEY